MLIKKKIKAIAFHLKVKDLLKHQENNSQTKVLLHSQKLMKREKSKNFQLTKKKL